MTKNSFRLKGKVPFITVPLQPILQRLYLMRCEYHMVLLSDPTGILGEIRTKNCLALKSKVAFISERTQPNLHSL
jgi:hypothetical protein